MGMPTHSRGGDWVDRRSVPPTGPKRSAGLDYSLGSWAKPKRQPPSKLNNRGQSQTAGGSDIRPPGAGRRARCVSLGPPGDGPSPDRLTVAQATVERFLARVTRL